MTALLSRTRLPAALRHSTPPRVETALVWMFAAAVLVVHDVGLMFRHPFWTDEAWVAVTTKYPISDLRQTTSSTPIGWSLLLRLVPFGGPERLRVVPLAFSAATVLVAYAFAHRLPWPNRWAAAGAGLAAAVGTLVVPAMLERNDLKQYTADATLALVVLATTSRLERHWNRRNVGLLLAAVVGGMLLSHPAAFLGIAAFGCVIGTCVLRQRWRHALEASVAGALAAAGMAAVYFAFDKPAVVPGLVAYWQGKYVPHSPHAALRFLHAQWQGEARYFGLGPAWLAVPLFLAGVVTLVRLGRTATGLTPVVLVGELVVLSALKKYPFLDLRTGTFFFVVVVVMAAIGLVGVAVALHHRIRTVGAVLLVVAGVAAFVGNGARFARLDTLPDENARQQTYYVAQHRAPDDVVVINGPSAAAFVYYWPGGGRPGLLRTDENFQRYLAVFPDQPDFVVTDGRDRAAVDKALGTALQRAAAHPGARIWLIRTHLTRTEASAWKAAATADRLVVRATGPRGLTVADPPT